MESVFDTHKNSLIKNLVIYLVNVILWDKKRNSGHCVFPKYVEMYSYCKCVANHHRYECDNKDNKLKSKTYFHILRICIHPTTE